MIRPNLHAVLFAALCALFLGHTARAADAPSPVGKWKPTHVNAKSSTTREDDPTKAMEEQMFKTMTLDVNEDKTFVMTVMDKRAEGTWVVEAGTLTLTVARLDGKEATEAMKKDTLRLTVSDDAKKLVTQPRNDHDPAITFEPR